MSSINSIKEQLTIIDNWILVSNKKNIIKGLQKGIGDNENILGLIDGIFIGGKFSKPASGTEGVLFITNKKIIFVSGMKSSHEKIYLSEINNISYSKEYRSINIKISLESSIVTFKTFTRSDNIDKFLKLINEPESGETKQKIINIEKDTSSITEDILSLLKNNDLINSFFDKSNRTIKKLSEVNPINNDPEKIINLNFLFMEAQKINKVISDYIENFKENEIKQFFINDLIALSSLCSMADNKISDEELIFISLILLPLNPGLSNIAISKNKEIFSQVTFPLDEEKYLIDYWSEISDYIKNNKIDISGTSLKSLNFLKNYDIKNGTSKFDKISIILSTFAQCLMKADGNLNELEEERLKQLNMLIHNKEIEADDTAIEEPVETLEEVMVKINALVGMDNIKEQINTLINLIKIQKERVARGFPTTTLSLHAVFHGPPGTGKTTIARLLGKVYRALGLLAKGQLIETDRAGLVAGYVGQTAIQVDKLVQDALDGILFIDEAYTLAPEHGGKDFGQEAIDTILKRMEDYRERLVVIVAGYPDEMKHFIYSNPGLKSRFSRYFYFDHYIAEDLIKIFDIFASNVEFNVTDEARDKLLNLLDYYFKNKDKTFGNGRLVRNLFEKIVEKQANRIAEITPLTDEILCSITKDDIPEPAD